MPVNEVMSARRAKENLLDDHILSVGHAYGAGVLAKKKRAIPSIFRQDISGPSSLALAHARSGPWLSMSSYASPISIPSSWMDDSAARYRGFQCAGIGDSDILLISIHLSFAFSSSSPSPTAALNWWRPMRAGAGAKHPVLPPCQPRAPLPRFWTKRSRRHQLSRRRLHARTKGDKSQPGGRAEDGKERY